MVPENGLFRQGGSSEEYQGRMCSGNKVYGKCRTGTNRVGKVRLREGNINDTY